MKTTQLIIALTSMSLGFICSYFMELTMQNAEQYLAITTLVFADGFFGIIAGIKREGFKTYKAIKIIRTLIFWVIMLTLILVIEKSIPGAGWLSETMLMPLVIFQLISTIKNASMAGFIKTSVLNKILDTIDKHKGIRE
ncbi:phage holin family protein [bacterium]|nr:phage holin family protein [bacterium]